MSKRKKYEPVLIFHMVDWHIALELAPKGGAVYLLTFPDGKQYVGQTTQLEKRMRGHAKFGAFTARDREIKTFSQVQQAIACAGVDNVRVDILEWNIRHKKLLVPKERAWILKLETLAPNGRHTDLPHSQACLSYMDSDL